jgi:gamma-glutamylcyclotransferase (GGCT)/AIG2-like uncharacterized protein YtfP
MKVFIYGTLKRGFPLRRRRDTVGGNRVHGDRKVA